MQTGELKMKEYFKTLLTLAAIIGFVVGLETAAMYWVLDTHFPTTEKPN